MQSIKFFVFLSLICIFCNAHLQSNELGFISVSVSQKGIGFIKDLLIDKAVSLLTPLELNPIEKSVKIPVVGKVKIVLSNIVVYHVDVSSSGARLDDDEDGIVINASGSASLSMDWKYTYKNWFVEVSDHGRASVEVEDMEVALAVSLKNQNGSLKLNLLECECDVDDISVELDGGASWLYQGVVDAFGDHIESAVADGISKKIRLGVVKIDSLLQSLPKEIAVDDVSALNVTFVDDPILSDSFVEFDTNGLFVARNKSLMTGKYSNVKSRDSSTKLRASDSCGKPAKMVAISLHEDVFNSASLVYFHAGLMHWTIDKIPDLSPLNTTEWRNVIPQLYQNFPNDTMNLSITVTSLPIIHTSDGNIEASIYSDVTINVIDDQEIIPVACISLMMSASGSAEISRNNITGGIKLESFTLSSKWSKVGDLQMHIIQPIIGEAIEQVWLPELNRRLGRGFPLPLIHGFALQNSEILCSDSIITVCSDAEFAESSCSINDVFAAPFTLLQIFTANPLL